MSVSKNNVCLICYNDFIKTNFHESLFQQIRKNEMDRMEAVEHVEFCST